jgi:hypothetical protein
MNHNIGGHGRNHREHRSRGQSVDWLASVTAMITSSYGCADHRISITPVSLMEPPLKMDVRVCNSPHTKQLFFADALRIPLIPRSICSNVKSDSSLMPILLAVTPQDPSEV